jgi:hypothetical protein
LKQDFQALFFYLSPMKIFLLFFLFFSLAAHAQRHTREKAPQISQKRAQVTERTKEHQFAVGLMASNFYYQEPGLMKDSGYLYGVGLQYLYQMNSTLQFRVDGELSAGTLTYDGHFMDGSPAKFEGEQFRIFAIDTTWAKDIYTDEPSVFGPFYGAGYRSTYDSKDNDSDYRRDYFYVYGIFGLQYRTKHSSQAASNLRLGLNYLVGGINRTYLSDFDPDLPDVTLSYNSGTAVKIAYEYTRLLQDSKKLIVGLAYTRWSVAPSQIARTPVGNFVEPANDTLITSLNLSYLF